jgi:hypothetical protein
MLKELKMSDIIYYKNGEETFRIPFPTPGTKCPETKLEIKMTEIEKVKGEIKVLEKKLALLEEIERHNAKPKMHLENEGEFGIVSYNDEIYYRLEYPTAIIWYKRKDGFSNDMMLVLILDLETHRLLEDKWNNQVLTQKDDEPYCPDDPEYYDEVEWDEKDNPKPMNEVMDRLENKYKQAEENAASYITDEVVNRMLKEWEENPPEFLKFELGKTLEALITRWWCDVFGGINQDWDMETAIDDLCDRVELWLPKSQSAAGSQSLGVEDMVEGFNDCLKKIKSKLRNKK